MQTRLSTALPVTELTVAEGNYSFAREGTPVDRIVLHTMVGTTASADSRFNQIGSQVSAHYGVGLDGSLVHWVDETNTAYANGNWQMNLRAVSIEHEDSGNFNGPRSPQLYETSSKLVADLCTFYSIACDRTHIIKHSEVPFPTACPDALDVDRIVAGAKQILTPTAAEPLVCDPKSVRDMLVAKAANFDEVADLWQLSEADRKAPTEGKWVVEQIKQVQTTNLILKGQLLKASDALQSLTTHVLVPSSTNSSPTPEISSSSPLPVVAVPTVAPNTLPTQANPQSLWNAVLSVFWKL